MHYADAKAILSQQNGMNVYRGCTHGCIYCDSRSVCYAFTHDFEDVEVKRNAPELLENALRRKRRGCMIATGSMCDPYLPLEQTELITRRCLSIINRYSFGVSVLTKSDLVLRDMDLLKSINKKTKAVVCMTLTTYDERLCRIIEPNVCTTARRAEVLRIFRDEGIPTVVWMTPILPFINDTRENIEGLLDCCFTAGVRGIISFGMGVTLREGDREYFYKKLDEHFPNIRKKYEQAFGLAYECPSPNSAELTALLRRECTKRSVMCDSWRVFDYMHEFEDKFAGEQLRFF